MSNLSRREFVAGAIAGVACSLTIRGTAFGQTTKPTTRASSGFDAGEISALKDGFNSPPGAAAKKVVIVKNGGKIYALPAVCTHQGGTLRLNAGVLKCVKHGATFDVEGTPTGGPAKRQLNRYGVTLKDGHLIVDTNMFFLEGEFEKEGAFVKAS